MKNPAAKPTEFSGDAGIPQYRQRDSHETFVSLAGQSFLHPSAQYEFISVASVERGLPAVFGGTCGGVFSPQEKTDNRGICADGAKRGGDFINLFGIYRWLIWKGK